MSDDTNPTQAAITLPTDTQILITRRLDAPRHLVYRAWTTPELVKRWWSGKRGTVTSVDIDLRVGGTWRYVMRTDDGAEVAFHGEYRAIVPDEELVHTEVYEMPGGADIAENTPLNTVTFTETDGGTLVSLLVECPTTELRDAILNSGMEIGLREQFKALDELTASLK